MHITLDGRRIYYDLTGPDQTSVVCFAHSAASDSGMWAEQLPALLAAGYRVLRLDMRGHGGSDPVPGDYTMEQLAQDVAAALEFLAITRVHLCGLSIGGMLGQAFAIRHAHKLLSQMLCNTTAQTPPEAADAIEAVTKARSLAPLADAIMERWFTDGYKPRNPGRWKQIRATIAATTAAASLNVDFVPQLPAVRVPTLVVCGAKDEGTPPAGNKKIAELIPGARYEEIADARHFTNVEHPDTFNRIMLGWLEARRG
jgi:3-oxoadipate enol-lactonase